MINSVKIRGKDDTKYSAEQSAREKIVIHHSRTEFRKQITSSIIDILSLRFLLSAQWRFRRDFSKYMSVFAEGKKVYRGI